MIRRREKESKRVRIFSVSVASVGLTLPSFCDTVSYPSRGEATLCTKGGIMFSKTFAFFAFLLVTACMSEEELKVNDAVRMRVAELASMPDRTCIEWKWVSGGYYPENGTLWRYLLIGRYKENGNMSVGSLCLRIGSCGAMTGRDPVYDPFWINDGPVFPRAWVGIKEAKFFSPDSEGYTSCLLEFVRQ